MSRSIQRNLIKHGYKFDMVIDDLIIIDLAIGREVTNATEERRTRNRSSFMRKRSYLSSLISEAMKSNCSFIDLSRVIAGIGTDG